MPNITRDDFIAELLSRGFKFTGNTDGAALFTREPHTIEVPRVPFLDVRWARAELRRCERRRPITSKSRPASPCCEAESRLRQINGGVLTFGCTACGKHWDRRAGAPHLRIVS